MNLSAVLLAGGESRRMGEDKATVCFEGIPLWRRQIELLRSMHPIEILISARTDPGWRPPDTKFVADIPPSRGPISGLAVAIEMMQGTHLLALAVDMPLMTSSQLGAVSNLANNSVGVLPTIGNRAEPLAAVYPRESLPHFSAALRGNDFSLQRLTRGLIQAGLLTVVSVSESEAEVYRSLNMPEDLDLEPHFPARSLESRRITTEG